MGFEARFREHAGHHLEVWGEVVFWKLYTMGLVRNGTTQKVLDLGVPPDELWSACTDYIENGSKGIVQDVPEQIVLHQCGSNRGHVPRVHLSGEVPDGG